MTEKCPNCGVDCGCACQYHCPQCKLPGDHPDDHYCVTALLATLAAQTRRADLLDAHLIERTAERDALRKDQSSFSTHVRADAAGIRKVVIMGLQADGAHHKQWFLERALSLTKAMRASRP
jgi:hypothetical protein